MKKIKLIGILVLVCALGAVIMVEDESLNDMQEASLMKIIKA